MTMKGNQQFEIGGLLTRYPSDGMEVEVEDTAADAVPCS